MPVRRRGIMALLAAACGGARGQTDWRHVAVPYYSNSAVVQSLYTHVFVPRAQAFAGHAHALEDAAQAYCSRQAAQEAVRARWRDAMLAWERLSAVAVGPLLQRRSARRIDFSPVRSEAVQRAIAKAPASVADLDQIGAPAKGLPALEWLWWTQPAAPDTPACAYAVLLAGEVAAEADAVLKAFSAAAAAPPDDEAAAVPLAEAVNQWIGGVERLRWTEMDEPRQAARTASFPRAASGSTLLAWQARWQALRELAVLDAPEAPAPGAGAVPLETLLRGHGLNAPADRLRNAVRHADAALRAVHPERAASVDNAVRALTALKQLADRDTAPALQVSASFTDADGD